nr:alkane 1-monooxygenase [Epibacterium ulvae]
MVILAALFGGPWGWAALAGITLGVFCLDHFSRRHLAPSERGADALLVAVGCAHFAVLIATLLGITHHTLAEALPVALSAGLALGQVSHPAAHEMIHHKSRFMRRFGRAIYGSILLGHHASAHMRVHHIHVATDHDPNSAPRGMGFYRFYISAWIGSFRAGLRAESAARARQTAPTSWISHPYVGHTLWAAAILVSAALFAQLQGMLWVLFICLYAQAQVFLADYVQHYGLRRQIRDTGKPEPVGPEHSWNAPHWYSSAMMLNAPRHSHHHTAPTTSYPALELTPQMPTLPYALPVMAVIALHPPLWRRIMARQLNALTSQ